MSKWEYKCVPLDRKGTKEDFSFSWKYGPWELAVDQAAKRLLPAGLDELGRQGWELAGVLPNDLWSEGTRTGNASHGVRTISCILLFKRPAKEAADSSPTPRPKPTTSVSASSPSTTAATTTPTSTPPASTPPAGTSPTGTSPTETSPSSAPSSDAPAEEKSVGDTSAGSTPPESAPPESAPPVGAPPATTPSDNPA